MKRTESNECLLSELRPNCEVVVMIKKPQILQKLNEHVLLYQEDCFVSRKAFDHTTKLLIYVAIDPLSFFYSLCLLAQLFLKLLPLSVLLTCKCLSVFF